MALIRSIIDFLTEPSNNPDGYRSLPYHGALLPLVLINLLYVSFVFRIGPWLMRNRQPYNVKNLILAYNVIQIVYNVIMAYYVIPFAFVYQPSPITCIVGIAQDHPLKYVERLASLMYVCNKYLDYMETIFFVLRKSYKQVTFLHVYHHLIMTTMSYVYLKYYGYGGHVGMIGVLNSVVHVFMYVYYLISALRPEMKKSLWWKKYITRLQLLQFGLILIHQTWPLLFEPTCTYPRVWLVFSSLQAVLMIYLFGSFYIKTYVRRPAQDKERKRQVAGATKLMTKTF